MVSQNRLITRRLSGVVAALITLSPVIAFCDDPSFAGKAVAGSSSINIVGTSGDTITVYQFDSGYPAGKKCGADDLPKGTILTVPASGSQSTSQNATELTGNAPQTISLSSPLVAATQLCLVETLNGTPTYSLFQTVVNPLDFGRFEMGFTGGVMISNEEESSNSSTASEYLDVGIAYSWKRASEPWPGLTTFLNTRLTSLPVSTSTTTTTTSATGGGATISQSLNVLTSQQSARILFGAYIPFQATRFFSKSNAFTIAPLMKVGFDTLLNPSIGSSNSTTAGTTVGSTSNAGTTISNTSAEFSSVYYFVAGGVRVAWDTFPNSKDEAPQPNSWLSFVFGNYSNLPSYVCSDSKFYNSVSKPITACKTPAVTSGGATTYNVYASRKLVPRIEVAGEARIPNSAFVLGMDANLSQYGLWLGSNPIDTLNKAGNDVRFYIGYKLDLASTFKKLGVSQ